MATKTSDDHYLTLSCPDKSGIVYAVTGLLAAQDLTILDLQQFSDPVSKRFFMRVHFGHAASLDSLQPSITKLAEEMQMEYEIRRADQKPKVLIMVSKIGHCLNDLLYRYKSGQLKIEIPCIVSNHPEFKALAESYGIPFHHLPVTKDTKEQQESQILELCKGHSIELIVLARYMQVLSPGLCSAMSGRIINIHHSFLPSFKGTWFFPILLISTLAQMSEPTHLSFCSFTESFSICLETYLLLSSLLSFPASFGVLRFLAPSSTHSVKTTLSPTKSHFQFQKSNNAYRSKTLPPSL